MSSICGIYRRDGAPVDPQIALALLNGLGRHEADRPGDWKDGALYFGCQLQCVTPESLREVLPDDDPQAQAVITADAIIDNRAELWDALDIDPTCRAALTDSRLILKAYQKWGRECPAHLVGDFAFAIWDRRAEELFCAVDQMGKRSFYYYLSPKLFSFATLIRPLFVNREISHKYCEEWISDYLAIPTVMHQLDSELTIYQDILMLPAGHTLTVGKDGVRKSEYWSVSRRKELRLNSDEEYEAALRDVLAEAVRCRLRSVRPVGIMLSGGLDSTSVAGIAAAELQKSDRRLRAFSSIPLKEYRNRLPTGRIADETAFIEAVRAHCGNIAVTYCRFEGKHALSDTDRLMALLEQPYKTLENLFWIEGILARAEADNIGVMLTGGVGNTTISYGSMEQCLISLLGSGKWPAFIGELRKSAHRKQANPLRTLVDVLKFFFPYPIQKAWYQRRNPAWAAPLRLSPINPAFAARIGQPARFKQYHYDPLFIEKKDAFSYRRRMLDPAHLSHQAGVYTKIALAHRLIIRDPTLDQRVVEFCMSVPVEQYCRDGRERSLLRRAMAGILPDTVRLNYDQRGRQSADFVQRLQPVARLMVAEALRIGELEDERKYLDIPRIHQTARKPDLMDEDPPHNYDLRMLLRSIIFSRFLKTW